MLPLGRTFYKMSGSGNDFVIVDAIRAPAPEFLVASRVQSVCARATGIGADGVVLLEPSERADYRMTYLNSDGSRADLCGNASLCSARLARELGLIQSGEFRFEADVGVLSGRFLDTVPEIDLLPVAPVRRDLPIRLVSGERWMGFVEAGVPHLVVRVDDVSRVDVAGRGRSLRRDSALGIAGANVNFVSGDGSGGWRMRTFERGVEGETLACGTGAVATAVHLDEFGESGEVVSLTSRSGAVLGVRLQRSADGWLPSLSGEARIVFEGRLGEV